MAWLFLAWSFVFPIFWFTNNLTLTALYSALVFPISGVITLWYDSFDKRQVDRGRLL